MFLIYFVSKCLIKLVATPGGVRRYFRATYSGKKPTHHAIALTATRHHVTPFHD